MIKKQLGINLVSVIFLLVIISGIATFMVTIGNVQQQTATLSILSSRALYAAQSGMQWAVRSVLASNDCSAFPATFSLSGGTSNNFSINATCGFDTIIENPDTYNVYRLNIVASRANINNPEYVSRTISAKVTDVP